MEDSVQAEPKKQQGQAEEMLQAQKIDLTNMASAQALAQAQAAALTKELEDNQKARLEAQRRANEAQEAVSDSQDQLTAAQVLLQAGDATASKTEKAPAEQALALEQARQQLAQTEHTEEPKRKSPRARQPTDAATSSTNLDHADTPTEPPKPPLTMYMQWLKDNSDRIQTELQAAGSSTHPSTEAGQQWQALDANIKQHYALKFKEETRNYRTELARYSDAAKQKFCHNVFPTQESTPAAEEVPTPEDDDDMHLEKHLEQLLDKTGSQSQFHIDYQTRQAVINFMQEHQDETILHGDIITWYQEETNFEDLSQDHIRNTVRGMIYQEGILKILTEPTLT